MFNIGFFFKLKNRVSTLFQGFVYPLFFMQFGKGARILRPRRIEGSNRMKVGDGAFVNNEAWLETINCFGVEPLLSIGKGVYIGNNSHVVVTQSVVIEDFVLIADRVYLADYSHGYEDVTQPILMQSLVKKGTVRIGTGSWLGEGVVVIGASIGKNSIVGAMSVVTHDVPDYSIAVGSPAKVIRRWCKESAAWVRC